MDDKLKKKINDHYQKGEGSIQQIAIFYRLSVPEVLKAIGQDEMLTVHEQGDLIDQSEAGPQAEIVQEKVHTVPYTTE